ncbi:MAG: DNA topoisomerase I [Candidatus Yanofskybacteria bacterium RIFCSPHIGHO2_02_FULL_44_12b]|uniref:DNA topoisomerase 1 n=2 Tax=Candidatus Yanofskyibacteriota TaxID=1752733 RepID=A0A1F8GP04_9BACT|nr:MAG: topoisomerase protein [Candidatus Yanofskybacteria bacterium GW2011_GWA2_44_9]OGN05271.1 MAG: DNA topoisomerase I [Candidatus Yanofskybacteria bacterium RIFCSPHIGHO2_01_FULL_44_24]OGN14970.1 MAG: DNA topoisomerase I [Candidatus Yanofskybacteria bacterium RIFCSPHIGHO2_02_FULL_44_12b]OGN26408.1 MAG: DNA topoisomerase I [Candidatus Yanofskybacteria bacterium RIFCSPLOWO2_01_FULL_44_22]
MNLIIVESPTKAKTISRFLGDDFLVASSYGHVRDLPKGELGVDTEKDFTPKYIIPTKARKNLTSLKKSAQKSDKIILATDEDREGESIAWHLSEAIGLSGKNPKTKPKKEVQRIVFHEITKKAIDSALKNPRQIDANLVDAQQARRILDRLVGYKLSPFLWKKVARGLSAGRVQSVALRLIVEREQEIEKFKPEEYWSVTAFLGSKDKVFPADLTMIGDKNVGKLDIKNEDRAASIVKDLAGADYMVKNVEKNEMSRSPFPPFTTSTLQQDGAKKLRFSAKQTMVIAQQLYEGVDIGKEGSVGLITYMRTDSLNLSEDSLSEAKNYIIEEFGEKYLEQRRYKTKSKSAQEAHEAIRPTDPSRHPDSIKQFLTPQQLRLYTMIWNRFMASQMSKAVFDNAGIDIAAKQYTFRANGSVLKFDGFLKIYPTKFEENELPTVQVQEKLDLQELKPEQHFTKPPARYNEASLIKILEKEGIGRPSTYAPIISTILYRNYVNKDKSRYFHPTEIGTLVNNVLVAHFPEIVDIKFTSKLENELDDIAMGKIGWVPVVKEFYNPFSKLLATKYEEVSKEEVTQMEKTDLKCEKCGSDMVVKMGRYGKFTACSNFPTCKNILKDNKSAVEPEKTGEKCDKCGEGEMVVRTGRFGKFIACSRYPKCKNTKKIAPATTSEPEKN